ncbi:MAG: hypothetical protein IK017_04550 [Paludibacteraceae bacterium]|nr:hypothetical protein [Paludibacteraceae bacterium]
MNTKKALQFLLSCLLIIPFMTSCTFEGDGEGDDQDIYTNSIIIDGKSYTIDRAECSSYPKTKLKLISTGAVELTMTKSGDPVAYGVDYNLLNDSDWKIDITETTSTGKVYRYHYASTNSYNVADGTQTYWATPKQAKIKIEDDDIYTMYDLHLDLGANYAPKGVVRIHYVQSK